MPSNIRPAVFEDCIAASALLKELGLNMPAEPAQVRVHWQRFWQSNPALQGAGPQPDLGWVMEDTEDAGTMVGFFGNIPLLYSYGTQRIIVADASQWGVLKSHRADTHLLCDAYFQQKNIDLLLVTTGIKPTGRIFEQYDSLKVPQPGYDEILFWVVNSEGFLQSILRKKNWDNAILRAGATVLSPALTFERTISRRKPSAKLKTVDRLTLSEISDDFDDLWQRKQNEAERLLACRNAACLRWHFEAPVFENKTTILACKNNRLDGYAIVVEEDAPDIGLKRLKIADVLIAGDDEDVFRSLLAEAYVLAQEKNCHVLELIGLPPHLRKIAQGAKPFSRRMPVWPAYYKPSAFDSDQLTRTDTWYLTPYDGDTLLM